MSKIPTINNTKLQISPTLKRKLQNIVLNSLQIGCPEEERHCLDDVPPINTYDCFYCYLDYPEFCLFKEDDTIRKLKQDLIVAKGRGDHYKQTLLAVAGSASLSFSSDEDDPFECRQCGRTDMKYPGHCRKCIEGSSDEDETYFRCEECGEELPNGNSHLCEHCENIFGEQSSEDICNICGYELEFPNGCKCNEAITSTEENVKLQNVVLNALQIGYPEYELDHPPRECVKCGNITYADDSICYKHRVASDNFDEGDKHSCSSRYKRICPECGDDINLMGMCVGCSD